MRKRICVLFLGLIVLCCKPVKVHKADNDLAQMNLAGKVKSVKEISYTAAVQSGNIIKGIRKRETSILSDYYMLFNTAGKFMERTAYNPDDSISYRLLYEYNNDGRLIGTRTFKPDGRLSYRHVMNYDPKGNQISEQSFNVNGKLDVNMVYRFNEYGKVIEYENTFYGTTMKSYFKRLYNYDSTGNLAELSTMSSKGEMINRVTYRYDKDGNKTEERIYTAAGNTESVIVYAGGNKISEKFIANDGRVIFEKSFKYEYDGKRNWVRRIDFKNNIPEYIVEREIAYYE